MKNSETSSTSGILDLAAIPKNVREPHSYPGFFRSPSPLVQLPPFPPFIYCIRNSRDVDKPVRIIVRQGPEQHRVHDAEDRRIRPNPQRQRQYGHEGEAGISPSIHRPYRKS